MYRVPDLSVAYAVIRLSRLNILLSMFIPQHFRRDLISWLNTK